MSERTVILRHEQIRQKINRIAHEIHENYFEEEEIFIVGIEGQGYILAERLANIIKGISATKVTLLRLKLNKENPLSVPITMESDIQTLNGKNVVLVDDVLNSGKTLIYAATHLLQASVKKMKTVCLVDRRHRRYPIRADFAGLTLSTTLQEHIEVEFIENNDTVYLC
jgi:pyrimidine operon attenuation protein / uracil phosphoribosyltransferase